ncbi:MAG: hypothetical protein IPN01_32785 [Deltaproteobacteria bacterium]|nr:hypothetical protein [Deltaproteobacteria bacterium]
MLPVYERLHLRRDLLIEQANIATLLLLYRDRKRRDEARALLTTAFHSAVELNLPAEIEHIRRRLPPNNLMAPLTPWPPTSLDRLLSAGVGAALLLDPGGPKVALWFSAGARRGRGRLPPVVKVGRRLRRAGQTTPPPWGVAPPHPHPPTFFASPSCTRSPHKP